MPASPRALVAAGTGLIAVTYGMIRFGYGLNLPVLAAELDLSSGMAGAIAAGIFAAYCVAALVAQRVLVAAGARHVLWGAAALAASGSTLVAVSWSAGALAVGVLVSVVAGTGSAAVWTFGRDVLGATGGLPERTTALLWCSRRGGRAGDMMHPLVHT